MMVTPRQYKGLLIAALFLSVLLNAIVTAAWILVFKMANNIVEQAILLSILIIYARSPILVKVGRRSLSAPAAHTTSPVSTRN